MESGEIAVTHLPLTGSVIGTLCIVTVIIAYLFVLSEEKTGLRKSKPVVIAAGAIWMLIAIAYRRAGVDGAVAAGLTHALTSYAELLLFLIAAMTYVSALTERRVFAVLGASLISHGFGYRALFWITGTLAFILSPVIDNLTTALVLGAVVSTVGRESSRFLAVSCINIVVAANAGGAFSPFGDITTLMVWQGGYLEFTDFMVLFFPSLACYLLPALIMQFAVPRGAPQFAAAEVKLRDGAKTVIVLFAATLATAVAFDQLLGLPPFLGMMTGLGYLQLFGFVSQRRELRKAAADADCPAFDVFDQIARAEWDTLLFFYGVVLCVDGLGFLGYLGLASHTIYGEWGPMLANISIGLVSGIVDNIPIMVSVLEMTPDMSSGQWLLVTLTAGTGGSLFSIGSAAGVALMGQARSVYTFGRHLRWTPIILLGYFAGIGVHIWMNANWF